MKTEILTRAQKFLIQEPDDHLKKQLKILLQKAEDGDEKANLILQDRFFDSVKFGTAGIRAKVASGTSTINQITVAKITWAILQNIYEHRPLKNNYKIIVAKDGRKHSEAFAVEVMRILCAAGVEVLFFEGVVPTPFCSFAVRYYKADAGIMITASHNAKEDNGYKVYSHHGSQITSPQTSRIEKLITTSPAYEKIEQIDLKRAKSRQLLQPIERKFFAAYNKRAIALMAKNLRSKAKKIKITYSPLHGVGAKYIKDLFKEAKFINFNIVESQQCPDSNFPTLTSLNPENKESLQLAIKAGDENNSQIILVNDPDADRLAVVVRDNSGWRILTGNEIGCLLAQHAIEVLSTAFTKKPVLATSIVSSRLLQKMANDNDMNYLDSATGFAQITKKIRSHLKRNSGQLLFAYEEALGYCVGDFNYEKDGISSAIFVSCLAQQLFDEGKTLIDKLNEIAIKYGLYQSLQWSVDLNNLAKEKLMNNLRDHLCESKKIAKLLIDNYYDFSSKNSDIIANLLLINIQEIRLLIRPSGTEDKIKFYLEINDGVDDVANLQAQKNWQKDKLLQVKSEISKFILALLG